MRGRRVRRGVVAAAATLVASVTLTACDKPVPNVTFLTGATTTVVRPSNYCFDPASHCHTTGKIVTINARARSSILVDVPKDVADQHWIVLAFTANSAGKSSPLDGAGSLGLVHNRHSARVVVPAGTGTYFLSVTELRGAAQTGTWTVRVNITE